jgi:hypothetical protein
VQIKVVDNDVLTPFYTCGKRGETIDVQVHGSTYSVWKLLDDLDKHIWSGNKVACKVCNGEKASVEKFIEAMREVGEAARKTATIFSELAVHLKFDLSKETND